MTELEERVAKAIAAAMSDVPLFHEHLRCCELEDHDYRALARAALEAIGIDEILEVLRPFARLDMPTSPYEHHQRIAALYKELGGK